MAEAPKPEPIETPCQRICVVDGMTSACIGCGRTLAEIAQWTKFTPAQRRAIMAELPARMARTASDHTT
jgi:predicted Fe-S protein YdhL (DUF1289 family)